MSVLLVNITNSWNLADAGVWAGLYECTRGIWKLGPNRNTVRHVIPVADLGQGLVSLGCFTVEAWSNPPDPANYPFRWTHEILPNYPPARIALRWEFSARLDKPLHSAFQNRHCNGWGQAPCRYGIFQSQLNGVTSVVAVNGTVIIP